MFFSDKEPKEPGEPKPEDKKDDSDEVVDPGLNREFSLQVSVFVRREKTSGFVPILTQRVHAPNINLAKISEAFGVRFLEEDTLLSSDAKPEDPAAEPKTT